MDFGFSQQEEKLRHEVREFLGRELPADWPGMGFEEVEEDVESDERWAFSQVMAKKLAQKGWLAMGWPREYGGQGRSHIEQTVFSEEMAYHAAPGVNVFGVKMLGPTLMVYGTEKQKKQHLDPIARGDVAWCEGFSEPQAGSDLAGLQTRAVADGDDFVIAGQKVWTTGAHRADWCFMLARTDPQVPKHPGIGFFLVDMKSRGITVRPLINMMGTHSFNEVFFDNVRVPKENLVGELNRGWYVAAATLDFERSGVEYSAHARRFLEHLVAYVREARPFGQAWAQEELVRNKLADMAVETEVARLLAYRVAWMQGRSLIPNYEASVSKVLGSELTGHVAEVGMEVLGLYGSLREDSPWAKLRGKLHQLYLASRSRTIAAGTSEVQRIIIAMRGLGLPRSY